MSMRLMDSDAQRRRRASVYALSALSSPMKPSLTSRDRGRLSNEGHGFDCAAKLAALDCLGY